MYSMFTTCSSCQHQSDHPFFFSLSFNKILLYSYEKMSSLSFCQSFVHETLHVFWMLSKSFVIQAVTHNNSQVFEVRTVNVTDCFFFPCPPIFRSVSLPGFLDCSSVSFSVRYSSLLHSPKLSSSLPSHVMTGTPVSFGRYTSSDVGRSV